MSDQQSLGIRDGSLITGDGQEYDISDVSMSISNEYEDAYYVGQHKINTAHDDEVACSLCQSNFEVPELFKASSPFKQIVYKLFLYGKLRDKHCDGNGGEFPFTQPGPLPSNAPNDIGGGIYYSGSDLHYSGSMTVDDNDVRKLKKELGISDRNSSSR